MELHRSQRELLDLLINNQVEPLTMEELKDRLNLSSRSLVLHHIRQLEKKKYLSRNPSNPKDYQILNDPDKLVGYVNLYGMAECGPDGTLLSGDPIDKIPVSPKLLDFYIEDAFMVRASGDSMKPDIHEGDFIIAKKETDADNGDVVICTMSEKVRIKKIYKDTELLVSINPDYEPIKIDRDSFRIEGIVKSIICNHP